MRDILRRRARRVRLALTAGSQPWPALILLGAVITNLNALTGAFVWDDRALLLQPPAIRRLTSILHQLTQPYLGQYWRPSVTIGHTLEYALWGLHPFGYHAVNLALHAAGALLVYGIWRRIQDDDRLAGIVGLLFAVHGHHVYAAAIAGRSGVLAVVGALAAWYCAMRAIGGRQAVGWYALSALSFAVALGAKEEAAALPPLMLAVGALQPWAGDTPAHWRRTTPPAVGFGLMVLVYLVLRGRVLGGGGLLASAWPALGWRLLSWPAWELHHAAASLSLVPFDLEFRGLVYPHLSAAYVAAGWLVWAVALALGWRLRRRQPAVLLGLVWALVAGLPTANLLPVYPETADLHVYMPPQFLYFRDGGLLGVWAAGLIALLAVRKRLGLTVLAAVVGWQGVLGTRVNAAFGDEVTLYRSILTLHPGQARIWMNLGHVLRERGALSDAVEAYRRSIELDPSPEAWNGLGLARVRAGDAAGAAEAFRAALQLDPTNTNAIVNQALLLHDRGQSSAALEWLGARLPGAAEPARLNDVMARIQRDRGDTAAALATLDRALAISPDDARLWNTLGTVRAAAGELTAAADAWRRAEALAPGLTPAGENLRRLAQAR